MGPQDVQVLILPPRAFHVFHTACYVLVWLGAVGCTLAVLSQYSSPKVCVGPVLAQGVLYLVEMIMIFYPGWVMASIFNKQGIIAHHVPALALISGAVLMPTSCGLSDLIKAIAGVWILI